MCCEFMCKVLDKNGMCTDDLRDIHTCDWRVCVKDSKCYMCANEACEHRGEKDEDILN